MDPSAEMGVDRGELRPPKFIIGHGSAPKDESLPNGVEKTGKANEDAYFVLPEIGAAGVFDGMGGLKKGNVVSQLARNTVLRFLNQLPENLELSEVVEAVRKALISANKDVDNFKQQIGDNTGTTASVVLPWRGPNGETKLVVGNVGDSRVYLQRNKKLRQVTLDDGTLRLLNLSEEKLFELQSKLSNYPEIKSTDNNENELLKKLFVERNKITQALGFEQMSPRISIVDLQPGDRILVFTDGIPDNLTDKEINDILSKQEDPALAAQVLIKAAQAQAKQVNKHPRAKPDDMTAIVMDYTGDRTPVRFSPIGRSSIESSQSAANKEGTSKEDKIMVGAKVWVRRSSGEFEDGWKVQGFGERGDVAVIKSDVRDGKPVTLRKIVPLSQLNDWNRPTTVLDIPNAKSLSQLNSIIGRLEERGLRGTHGFYTSRNLIEIINGVLEGRGRIDQITRAGGLREKATDLLINAIIEGQVPNEILNEIYRNNSGLKGMVEERKRK